MDSSTQRRSHRVWRALNLVSTTYERAPSHGQRPPKSTSVTLQPGPQTELDISTAHDPETTRKYKASETLFAPGRSQQEECNLIANFRVRSKCLGKL